jgi:hypothetical protein
MIIRSSEDSEMTKDVPEDNENDNAHAAAAAGKLSRTVSGSNAAQQLAHRFSAGGNVAGTQVMFTRPGGSETHDAYRASGEKAAGVPASGVQNYIANRTIQVT